MGRAAKASAAKAMQQQRQNEAEEQEDSIHDCSSETAGDSDYG